MELVLESLVILSSWNLGHVFVSRIRVIEAIREILSLAIAGLIITLISFIFPWVRF